MAERNDIIGELDAVISHGDPQAVEDFYNTHEEAFTQLGLDTPLGDFQDKYYDAMEKLLGFFRERDLKEVADRIKVTSRARRKVYVLICERNIFGIEAAMNEARAAGMVLSSDIEQQFSPDKILISKREATLQALDHDLASAETEIQSNEGKLTLINPEDYYNRVRKIMDTIALAKNIEAEPTRIRDIETKFVSIKRRLLRIRASSIIRGSITANLPRAEVIIEQAEEALATAKNAGADIKDLEQKFYEYLLRVDLENYVIDYQVKWRRFALLKD